MKTAAISDIHGNIHALAAVLGDAKKENVSRYVFLGDYYMDMPYPNEVVDAIIGLDAVFVRGNKEDYLRGLNIDKRTWTVDQNASLYWNFRHLTWRNYTFLKDLPEEAVFGADGIYFRACHMPELVFRGTAVTEMSSRNFYRRMKKRAFTHKEYLEHVNYLLSGDEALDIMLDKMPDGCYLFGHTHNQWHWQYRGKLLLNPGSCGMPLNFDNAAAYSIIERVNGTYHVTERRVQYDVKAAEIALCRSNLYKAAPVWSSIMVEHLQLAEDHVQFLVKKAKSLGEARGEYGEPFSNEVWREACEYYVQNYQKGGL